MNKQLKVALICHFSNPEVREKLPLSGCKIENYIRKILNKRNKQLFDYAPWVTNLIYEFEKRNDIEIHIISPHKNLKKFKYSFSYNNIHYHFFRPDDDILIIKIYRRFFNVKRPKYYHNRYLINQFLKDIKPDIVNLVGAENPYYSISALDINNLPLMLTAQTVYTNPLREKLSGDVDQYRWDLELKIQKKIEDFCSEGLMHNYLILHNNPKAIIFRYTFPYKQPPIIDNIAEKYDFVFFAAGVAKKKGVEDTIQALKLVKKEFPEVTLNIVGKCAADYRKFLDKMIEELRLKDNIEFTEYFIKQSDMHKHIQQAKYAVLPVKLDVISSTIIEAMILGFPVITYKTTGTPFLNKYGEAVLISEIDDVNSLAKNMLRVMKEPELVEKMLANSKVFIEREYDNKANMDKLVNIYNAVYKHYYNREHIPKELLFNPDEFPEYKKVNYYD